MKKKIYFCVLKINEERSGVGIRILIRTKMSRIPNTVVNQPFLHSSLPDVITWKIVIFGKFISNNNFWEKVFITLCGVLNESDRNYNRRACCRFGVKIERKIAKLLHGDDIVYSSANDLYYSGDRS